MEMMKLPQVTEPRPMYVEVATEEHGTAGARARSGDEGLAPRAQYQGAMGRTGEPRRRAPGLRGDGASPLTLQMGMDSAAPCGGGPRGFFKKLQCEFHSNFFFRELQKKYVVRKETSVPTSAVARQEIGQAGPLTRTRFPFRCPGFVL